MNLQLGHNIRDLVITVEVRLFNSITRFAGAGGSRRRMTLAAGTTLGELADQLSIPRGEVFLVLVNDRDVTPGRVGQGFNAGHQVEAGDVVALSGAVPYSYGYGAPVV